MNQSQRELRRAAAEAFMESLDQLGDRLNTSKSETPQAPSPTDVVSDSPTDADAASAWDDAAADIEQFMQIQP